MVEAVRKSDTRTSSLRSALQMVTTNTLTHNGLGHCCVATVFYAIVGSFSLGQAWAHSVLACPRVYVFLCASLQLALLRRLLVGGGAAANEPQPRDTLIVHGVWTIWPIASGQWAKRERDRDRSVLFDTWSVTQIHIFQILSGWPAKCRAYCEASSGRRAMETN